MKKALPFLRVIRLVLVIVLLVLAICFRCSRSKAEEASDWFPDDVTSTPLPFPDWGSLPTSEPLLTSSPDIGGGDRDSVPANVQDTLIYTSLSWVRQQTVQGQDTFYYQYVTGAQAGYSQGSWMYFTGTLVSELDYDWWTRGNFCPQALSSNVNYQKWSERNQRLYFTIRDRPTPQLGAGYRAEYIVSASDFLVVSDPNLPASTQAIYDEFGIDSNYFTHWLSVSWNAQVVYNSGQFQDFSSDTVYSWDDFRQGIKIEIPFNPVTLGDYVTRINVGVIVDNYLVGYMINSDVGREYPNRDLGWFLLNPAGRQMHLKRSIYITTEQDNRNWWQNLFMPTQEDLQEVFDSYLQDLDGQGEGTLTYFVMKLRDIVYSWTANPSDQHFYITLPEMHVTINGTQNTGWNGVYTFFNGETFDWGAFINSGQMSRLRTTLWLITDFMGISGFVASMWALFTRALGLKLWSGVDDDRRHSDAN